MDMVKGVTRRVVVVEPDDRALFEQAIFLVRDNSLPKGEMLREACRIADRYLGGSRIVRYKRRFSAGHLLAAFAVGAAASGLVWAAVLAFL